MSNGSASLRSRPPRQAGTNLLGAPVPNHIRERLLQDIGSVGSWPVPHAPAPALPPAKGGQHAIKERPEIAALLSEIVARTAAIDLPLIQFCDAGLGRRASVARDFAVAAASTLGRTLLVEVLGKGIAHADPAGHCSNPRRSDIIPNCDIPGLYHASILCLSGRIVGPEQPLLRALPDTTTHGFRMVVLDCAPPARCADTITLAGACSGTILVVEARRTRLPEIHTALRLLAGGGGKLFGTVLQTMFNPISRPRGTRL